MLNIGHKDLRQTEGKSMPNPVLAGVPNKVANECKYIHLHNLNHLSAVQKIDFISCNTIICGSFINKII